VVSWDVRFLLKAEGFPIATAVNSRRLKMFFQTEFFFLMSPEFPYA
jgi:hypothetical protein